MVENNCDQKYKWIHYIDHEQKREMWFMRTKEGECFNKDFEFIGNLIDDKFHPKEGFVWPEKRSERKVTFKKDWQLALGKLIIEVQKEESATFEGAIQKVLDWLNTKNKELENLNRYINQ